MKLDLYTMGGNGTGYLEYREQLLCDIPQMASDKRYYHLGVDVNAPAGTEIYAPFDAEVIISEYEPGKGNYGGMVVIRVDNYYILFGHLDPSTIAPVGTRLAKGQLIGRLGDESCNGDWFPHLHLQVLTQQAFDNGWVSKGYCTEHDLPRINEFCPDPMYLLEEGIL